MADVIRGKFPRPRKPRPERPEHRRRDELNQLADSARRFFASNTAGPDDQLAEEELRLTMGVADVISRLRRLARAAAKIDLARARAAKAVGRGADPEGPRTPTDSP